MRPFLILACVTQLLPASAATATPTPKQVPASALADQPKTVEIRDWFAFGSGCRSKKDQPGDETMLFLGAKKESPNEYAVRFALPKYALDGAKPVKSNPTFARQCAMRVAAFLPKGLSIRKVAARVPVIFSKDGPVRLELGGQLMLGQDVVAQKISDFPAGKISKDELVQLDLSAEKGNSGFPAQTCGAAKIVGFDLSITNWRETLSPNVYATLGGSKEVEILFTVEPCSTTGEK